VRVLLADDHAPTREELRLAIEHDERFVVCAEAIDAPAAVQAAVENRPDICLLDVNMPGWGPAAAWEISARLPRSKIVMLTVSRDSADLFAALRAGADGYLLKDMDPRSLPRALSSILRGEVTIPRELVGAVIEEFRDRSARRRRPVESGPERSLTSREWETLDLVRQGLTTGEIARRLVVSPVTVRTHVRSILRKLRAKDRAELISRFRTGSERERVEPSHRPPA
jgi:two-component system nitrate/nitrite response regulator NarL